MIPAKSVLAFGALCILGCAPADRSSELEERRAQVAATGAQVMPFDLDATTHVFEKTEFGGIQQVVADAADPRQVALIREHLEMEAERFARGDFHDPAMIHGEHMAGLHQLVQGHERLSIEYSEIDDGGQILYSTHLSDNHVDGVGGPRGRRARRATPSCARGPSRRILKGEHLVPPQSSGGHCRLPPIRRGGQRDLVLPGVSEVDM